MQCPAGYFCVGGAADKAHCATGGYWCPQGGYSATTYTCAIGHYGTGAGSASYVGSSCSGSFSGTASRVCGHFACLSVTPDGRGGCSFTGEPRVCDSVYSGGRLSAVPFQGAGCTVNVAFSTCAGACACAAGHYCPPGSTNASGVACPVAHYCAGGGGNATLCPAGCVRRCAARPRRIECSCAWRMSDMKSCILRAMWPNVCGVGCMFAVTVVLNQMCFVCCVLHACLRLGVLVCQIPACLWTPHTVVVRACNTGELCVRALAQHIRQCDGARDKKLQWGVHGRSRALLPTW